MKNNFSTSLFITLFQWKVMHFFFSTTDIRIINGLTFSKFLQHFSSSLCFSNEEKILTNYFEKNLLYFLWKKRRRKKQKNLQRNKNKVLLNHFWNILNFWLICFEMYFSFSFTNLFAYEITSDSCFTYQMFAYKVSAWMIKWYRTFTFGLMHVNL